MPIEVQPAVLPHLTVDDAAAAIDFYVKAFDAVEHGRVPGPDGKLIHASLGINGSSVMLNDDFPEMSDGKSMTPTALGGTPVTIHLVVTDVEKKFQQAVDAGATVVQPLDDQFWGDRYGVLQDPFGHQWSMGQPVREVSHGGDRRGDERGLMRGDPRPPKILYIDLDNTMVDFQHRVAGLDPGRGGQVRGPDGRGAGHLRVDAPDARGDRRVTWSCRRCSTRTCCRPRRGATRRPGSTRSNGCTNTWAPTRTRRPTSG